MGSELPRADGLGPIDTIELSGGTLWTDSELNNFVFDSSGRVVEELCTCVNSSRANDFNAGSSIFVAPSARTLSELPSRQEQRHFSGRVANLSCFNVASISYGHWLTDVLPRLALYLTRFRMDEIDFFYFPSTAFPWQRETLELLDINPRQVIEETTVKYFSCDVLLTTPFPRPNWDVPCWIPGAVKSLFGVHQSVAKPLKRSFYATRKDAKWRKVTNEEFLEKRLLEAGFEILTMADLTFREKISLFADTASVISVHGSSLGNTLFCQKGAHVLEIFGPGQVSPLHKQIAHCIPLRYSSLSFDSDSSSQQDHFEAAFSDITVDVDRVISMAR